MMIEILILLNAIGFIGGQLTRFSFQNGVAFTLLDLTVSITFLIWIANKLYKKEKITGFLSVNILGFIVVCALSLVLNAWVYPIEHLAVGALYLLRWTVYSSLYFIVRDLGREKKGFVIQSVIFSGVTLLISGFLQYIFYPNLKVLYSLGWDEHLYRMFSTFLDPNYFGSFLVLFFLFILEYRSKSKKYIFLLLGITLAIVLTYSRSAAIMGIIGIFVYFIIEKKYASMLKALICFVILILLLSNYRIEGLNPFRTASSSARLDTALNATYIIKDHPLFGVGFNTYRYAQNNYGFRDSAFWQTSHADAGTDNSFLFILATTGIAGFISYILFIRKVYRIRAIQRAGTRSIFVTLITALLVGSIFNNLLFYTPIMAWMWVYLGLMENN